MTDLFFYLSKIFWLIVQPDHFLLLVLLIGLLRWRRASSVVMVWGSVLALLCLSVFPAANYLLEPLEQRFPQPDLTQIETPIAGIIVLGGGEEAELSAVHDMPQFNSAAERLMVLPALMLRYPQAKVIFTGGSGSLLKPQYRGGDVAKQWLTEQGLGARLIVERDSRNTFQNAMYSREIIDELKQNDQENDLASGKWLLVTSAFHMPRSVGVYRQAGIDVIPYPVDYRQFNNQIQLGLNANMSELNVAVREWIGLAAYYLTDKTAVLLPKPFAHRSVQSKLQNTEQQMLETRHLETQNAENPKLDANSAEPQQVTPLLNGITET
ncbi:YdcF family protein [Neptuniibacter marinus]|uniref:YdcF family protein n=1 Tax=Neptuniibacter marinus TaxID=1806670 RepID=UPI003B5BAA81